MISALAKFIADLNLASEQEAELARLIQLESQSAIAKERFQKNNSLEVRHFEVVDSQGKVLMRRPEGDRALEDARANGYTIRPVSP